MASNRCSRGRENDWRRGHDDVAATRTSENSTESRGGEKREGGEKQGKRIVQKKEKKKKKEKEGGEEIKNWIKHRWKAIPEGHGYQRRWFVGGHPISVPCQRNSMGVKRRCSYVRDYKRRPVSIP